eukprot:Colp12_sorted_trinity150504_noHs@27250
MFRSVAAAATRTAVLSRNSPVFGIATLRLMSTVRRFTKDHEWVSVSGEIGTVGITDYAQNALGDVAYVELPEVGRSVGQKDQCGAVESVKAASDIYAPVSGEVTEVNEKLSDEPQLLNKAPYTEGWLIKMKLTNPSELDDLLDEDAYKKYCEEIAH